MPEPEKKHHPSGRPHHPETYHGTNDGDYENIVRDGDITNQEIAQTNCDMEHEGSDVPSTFETAMNIPDPFEQAKAAQGKQNE